MPQVDALLEKALGTVDDGQRAALLAEASRIAMADYGALPLHFEMTTWAFRKELELHPARRPEHRSHHDQARAVMMAGAGHIGAASSTSPRLRGEAKGAFGRRSLRQERRCDASAMEPP